MSEGLPADDIFLDRDLSWLEFNRRVLSEASDLRTPLLERVRFLGIFTTNLDEFFMKRVGLLRAFSAGRKRPVHPDQVAAAGMLPAIRTRVTELLRQQADCFRERISSELPGAGIRLLRWDDLSESERKEAADYFQNSLFPVLTPLAVDPGHPFPFISNLSESVGVVLHHPDRGENLFARIKVPESLPRWVPLRSADTAAPAAATPAGAPPAEIRLISLYDIIQRHLDLLFPGMLVVGVMLFRVTRNAEVELDEEEAEDVREVVEEGLRQRRFAGAVRLEHGPDPNYWIVQFLMEELELNESDVYEVPAGLEYQDLRAIASLNRPKLRFEPWTPMVPAALAEQDADIFGIIRNGDVLVHHPYESFEASVERFVQSAAADPKVLALKMTLYRTGDDSPFIPTLVHAAEARKQVVCLVELKARFDEERNILLARKLEKAGVHVVYGVVGLKTHTKMVLVVRQDTDRIRCYAHIGTGNYHTQTAKLYTDLGLLTSNPQITAELVELFHYLTGRSLKQDYTKLLVAPVNMRQRFMQMIEREIENKKAGRPAAIIAKMNSLEDRRIIKALYGASQAGVPIDLIVRGFCCLRPGVSGLSDNIRVISIIGRYLEHSRIYYFRNGQPDPTDGEIYIGSADWMYRNLGTRVEVVTPIDDRTHKARCREILQVCLSDHRQAWDMQPDGSYVQRQPRDSSDVGTQQALMDLNRARSATRVGAASS
jgi:polyphosphate kinase